jgi:hypothetical protein
MRDFEFEKRGALYTAFLNPKGRIMFDAIIAKPILEQRNSKSPEYWIDV